MTIASALTARLGGLRHYLPALIFASGPVVNAADLYERFTPVKGFELVRAMGVAGALAGLAALVLWLLPGRDRVKAAGLSLLVVFTGVYPTVARWMHVRPYGWADFAVFAIYLAALVAAVGLIAWLAPEALSGADGVLRIIAALFLAYLAWFGFAATRREPTFTGLAHPGGEPVTLPARSPAPDIIHIIFDGLGRLDYLERDYGIAAASERTALTSGGMAISDDAVANYSQTYLSVGAMLSMGYLDDVVSHLGSGHDRSAVEEVINRSTVVRALVDRGYQFTLLSSGYEVLEGHPDASDGIVGPTAFGEFESYVFRRSPFRMLPIGPLTYLPHRARTRELLERLEEFQPGPRPRYVLAHVLVPHPPFVFGPAGESRTPPGLFTVADGNGFAGSNQAYRDGYAAQARFVFTTIERLSSRLGALPARPILIVSGDHGPGLGYDQIQPLKGETASRMALFLGINGPIDRGSPVGSPVNIYRRIFNDVFGTKLPQLPNRSFVSAFTDPYNFHEVHVPPAAPGVAPPSTE